jgi:hypothetical protein
MGGGGFTSMTAGGGSRDTFIGGTGTDDMNAKGAESAIFEFDSAHGGGQHTIANFDTKADKLELVGYGSSYALSHAVVSGGNTIVTLQDGAIALTNFTHLTASNFTK